MEIPHGPTPHPDEHSDDTFRMAVTIMAASVLVLFVLAVIPAFGLHLVIGVAALSGAGVLLLHRRHPHRGRGR
jgi:hypothetical protein